ASATPDFFNPPGFAEAPQLRAAQTVVVCGISNGDSDTPPRRFRLCDRVACGHRHVPSSSWLVQDATCHRANMFSKRKCQAIPSECYKKSSVRRGTFRNNRAAVFEEPLQLTIIIPLTLPAFLETCYKGINFVHNRHHSPPPQENRKPERS